MSNPDPSANVGTGFDQRLPPVYSVLRAGANHEMVIEVMAQLDTRRVRGISLTPAQGLARGMGVSDTGKQLEAPVGKSIISRMFDVFGPSRLGYQPTMGTELSGLQKLALDGVLQLRAVGARDRVPHR